MSTEAPPQMPSTLTRIEIYGRPDKLSRSHFAIFWLADYHPGHPAGEHRRAERAQHFRAPLPREAYSDQVEVIRHKDRSRPTQPTRAPRAGSPSVKPLNGHSTPPTRRAYIGLLVDTSRPNRAQRTHTRRYAPNAGS